MAESELEPVDGVAAGAWIGPALEGGFGGHVKQQIPQIYDGYARIFHPASDREGNEVTWGEVARRLMTTAHPEMQWHAIVGSYDYSNFRDSRWSGGNPNISELDDDKMDALCAILARHTGTPDRCFFGLSTIHGGVADEFPDAPLFELPSREFVILAGPLSAIDQIALSSRRSTVSIAVREGEELPPDYEPPEHFRRQAPNLIWPEDRAWLVASEYDFDSTLVGGSRQLIDAILASPDVETWEVDGEVSLQADADKLNPVPDPPPGFDEPQDPRELQRSLFEEVFESLRGEIVAAAVGESGVLELDVNPGYRQRWRLEAANSDWSPTDPTGLASLTIESVELNPDTDALRCQLSDGSVLEIRPRDRQTDGEPPSWRVELPGGMNLKHGPELLLEFPDES